MRDLHTHITGWLLLLDFCFQIGICIIQDTEMINTLCTRRRSLLSHATVYPPFYFHLIWRLHALGPMDTSPESWYIHTVSTHSPHCRKKKSFLKHMIDANISFLKYSVSLGSMTTTTLFTFIYFTCRIFHNHRDLHVCKTLNQTFSLNISVWT